MDIPPKVSIPICIEQGSVYWYRLKAINHDGTLYEGDRFFIVMNACPKSDRVIVLTTITKQIANQEAYIRRIAADSDTLVCISPSDLPCLRMESVVNCNRVYELTMPDLITKVQNGGKVFHQKLPKSIINALVSGVLKSKLVSGEHKKLLL